MTDRPKEKNAMKSALSLCLYLLASLIVISACKVSTTPMSSAQAGSVSIVPKPKQLSLRHGSFELTARTAVICEPSDERSRGVALYLAEKLGAATGGRLTVSHESPVSAAALIVLRKSSDAALGDEGYLLRVRRGEIAIEAAAPAGLFYGVQTILQLLPADALAGKGRGAAIAIPCLDIQDSPRLKWRGLMLDCSRHFFPKDFVLKYIDYMAAHKMNSFHWHLTDDQGWRIEIKKYPRLTEVGAWRVDREDLPWNERPAQKEGEKATYGGFYTQDDIREVVAYAQSRFITIVPEIEMPGHCLAALAAYPQYSCTGGPFTVPPGGVWPILDVYCPGNEGRSRSVENVLTEVCDLFPSEYIHIGGDEVDKATWKACPKCQARIAAEGLKDEEELQSYFVKRVEKFLNSKGKKLIGWDEILEGGLAPNAAVMSWRGIEGGIAAARAGHDVVMTPTTYCYFDYYQGDPANEPPGIGGYIPLRKVYSFEPAAPELTPAEAAHIIGAQANLWTEYVPTTEHAEYMTYPRAAAIAEIGWTPKEARDWTDFTRRMDREFERYEAMGIHFARSAYAVQFGPAHDAAKGTFGIKLETDTYRPDIRYTLDGSDPVASSPAYARPFVPKKSGVIKAAAFLGGKPVGKPAEVQMTIHKALGVPATLEFPPAEPNAGAGPAALTDGLHGSASPGNPHWVGFQGDDLVATIKLKKAEKIHRVSTGFLQRRDSWVLLPTSVEVAVSSDGKNFESVATLSHDISPLAPETVVKEFAAEAEGRTARFVRVHAKNIGLCPPGHRAAGQKAWLFADEIVVE